LGFLSNKHGNGQTTRKPSGELQIALSYIKPLRTIIGSNKGLKVYWLSTKQNIGFK